MKETRLHDAAVAKGYTVLIPFLILPNATETMGLVQRRLEIIVTNAMKKYRIPVGKLVIGGHSIGGLYAMCYAETTQKPGRDSLVKPAAVFGVDPPLDLKRLYNGYDRAMKEGVGLNSEATMITERFRKIFGGTPSRRQPIMKRVGLYGRCCAGGNTHYLKNMPVRLYCDPDINWFIRERQTSVGLAQSRRLSFFKKARLERSGRPSLSHELAGGHATKNCLELLCERARWRAALAGCRSRASAARPSSPHRPTHRRCVG